MTKPIYLKDFFVWTYSNQANYPGYNFFGTTQSCASLTDVLIKYRDRNIHPETCCVSLSSVTSKVLRIVNSKHEIKSSFDMIRFCHGETVGFEEEEQILTVRLSTEDLNVFLTALNAMIEGIGDFEIFDSQAWFWTS